LRRLRWSAAAANDLEQISEYLHQHPPSFAAPTVQRLYDAARSLKELPFVGRPGRKTGTRELVLAPLPYVLVYSVQDEFVHILRFLHTSREQE
jgi:toxin ParE1/3/4